MGKRFLNFAYLEPMYDPLVQEFILKYVFPCNLIFIPSGFMEG